MATGLDFSAGRISGRTIREAGHAFVVRYCGTPGRTKNIVRSEFQDLVSAGLTCWLVYENDTEDHAGGFNGGVAAARAARADADAIGYPSGGVIFFCADRHLAPAEVPVALAYLDGAASVLGRGAVGAYGFSEFINAAKAQGKAAYFWQCGSRSAVGAGTHIYQRNSGVATTTLNGVQCDINDLLIPIGGASGPAPSAPGGIEDMALDTKFRDSFGNEQTVQSFMVEVMRKLNDLHFPAVVAGSVPSRIPGDKNTTNVFDMIKDSTAWTNQTLALVASYKATIDRLAELLANQQGLDADAVKAAVKAALEENVVHVDVSVAGKDA